MSVRLFVGNLPYDVTESDLREFFSPIGPLSTVIVPMDRDTGKPRGFAFIEFSEREQADEATRRLNNQPLKGRNVTINEARARESRSGPAPSTRPSMRPSVRPGGGYPRPGTSARPSPAAMDLDADPLEKERAERAERRSRNFKADAKPSRKKKQAFGARGDAIARKGPIRERSGGQFFGGMDEEDDFEDDSEYKRSW